MYCVNGICLPEFCKGKGCSCLYWGNDFSRNRSDKSGSNVSLQVSPGVVAAVSRIVNYWFSNIYRTVISIIEELTNDACSAEDHYN